MSRTGAVSTPATRKPRTDGVRSRRGILAAAAALATTVGLDGLSIGTVATATGLSKGGISAHFASKEALQLATIDYAMEVFQREVLEPAAAAEPGAERLRSICRHDLSYIERRVFPGGCFFSSVAAEFCAREGAVKERIAEYNRVWMSLLADTAGEATARGEFTADVDRGQLAFELNAIIVSANFAYMLYDDPDAIRRGQQAIEERIQAARAR